MDVGSDELRLEPMDRNSLISYVFNFLDKLHEFILYVARVDFKVYQ